MSETAEVGRHHTNTQKKEEAGKRLPGGFPFDASLVLQLVQLITTLHFGITVAIPQAFVEYQTLIIILHLLRIQTRNVLTPLVSVHRMWIVSTR